MRCGHLFIKSNNKKFVNPLIRRTEEGGGIRGKRDGKKKEEAGREGRGI
jgi:hypothetical protein